MELDDQDVRREFVIGVLRTLPKNHQDEHSFTTIDLLVEILSRTAESEFPVSLYEVCENFGLMREIL